MDRMTTNILVFRKTDTELELISSLPLDDEDSELVSVYLPPLAA